VTLLLPQIEELEALMLRLPRLVDAVEREDSQAQSNSREWLAQIEGAFERNRLAPQAATVAALRAELRMVALGASPPTVSLTGQPRARRIREAGLLDVLRRAEQTIAAALASTLTAHEEAEGLIRQLLAIARHKGVLGSAAPGPDDEIRLREVWRAMCSDPDMATGAVRVLGLVGEADALALLDRTLGAA
jgi:hypothetical protein